MCGNELPVDVLAGEAGELQTGVEQHPGHQMPIVALTGVGEARVARLAFVVAGPVADSGIVRHQSDCP